MTLRRPLTALLALSLVLAFGSPVMAASTDGAAAAKRIGSSITSVTPAVLNPTPDTAQVVIDYTSDADAVTLEVRDAAANLIFDSPDLPAGTAEEYVWSPVRDSGDQIPPDGRYHIVLIAHVGLGTVEADRHRVVLDTVAPPIGSVTSDTSKIYPFHDGYLDVARFTVTGIGHSADRGHLTIKNADGVVRRLPFSVARSSAHVGWNGTDANGNVVEPGRYAYRAMVKDAAGNVSRTSPGTIAASARRAVAMTFTKRVDAAFNTYRDWPVNIAGRCSNLYSPGVRDWPSSVGFYSGVLCHDTSGAAGVARGLYALHVPVAAWYDRARVRTWGGSTYRRDHDTAEIQFLNGPRDYAEYGAAQRLRSKVGWHGMVAVEVDKLIKPDVRNLGWSVTTRDGNWYDVKKFVLTLHYHVLRLP